MRLKARKDANHNEIADALKARGYSVADTSQLGGGFPDMVVAGPKGTWLFEVKRADLPPSARKLTPDEVAFMQGWRGLYAVILTADEAIALLEA